MTGIVFDGGSPGGPHLVGVSVQACIWHGEVAGGSYVTIVAADGKTYEKRYERYRRTQSR